MSRKRKKRKTKNSKQRSYSKDLKGGKYRPPSPPILNLLPQKRKVEGKYYRQRAKRQKYDEILTESEWRIQNERFNKGLTDDRIAIHYGRYVEEIRNLRRIQNRKISLLSKARWKKNHYYTEVRGRNGERVDTKYLDYFLATKDLVPQKPSKKTLPPPPGIVEVQPTQKFDTSKGEGSCNVVRKPDLNTKKSRKPSLQDFITNNRTIVNNIRTAEKGGLVNTAEKKRGKMKFKKKKFFFKETVHNSPFMAVREKLSQSDVPTFKPRGLNEKKFLKTVKKRPHYLTVLTNLFKPKIRFVYEVPKFDPSEHSGSYDELSSIEAGYVSEKLIAKRLNAHLSRIVSDKSGLKFPSRMAPATMFGKKISNCSKASPVSTTLKIAKKREKVRKKKKRNKEVWYISSEKVVSVVDTIKFLHTMPILTTEESIYYVQDGRDKFHNNCLVRCVLYDLQFNHFHAIDEITINMKFVVFRWTGIDWIAY